MAKPSKLAGALAKDPTLKRVSPGVYRNAQGGLVNSRGGALPGQRPQRSQRSQLLQRPPTQSSTPGRMPQPRPQMPNVRAPSQAGRDAYDMERIAQERARTIQNGGMVTMDYNPQRDNRVNEILGRMPQGNPGMFQKPGQLSPEDMNRINRIGMGQVDNPVWNVPNNGPGSPNDVNPWFNPNQQMPIQDLAYRPPAGTPMLTAEQMYQAFQQQQRQQPNTVSGMLQQGGQQPQQPQQPQTPNPYMKQY
jgi:hypothetical protein